MCIQETTEITEKEPLKIGQVLATKMFSSSIKYTVVAALKGVVCVTYKATGAQLNSVIWHTIEDIRTFYKKVQVCDKCGKEQ